MESDLWNDPGAGDGERGAVGADVGNKTGHEVGGAALEPFQWLEV